MTTTSTTTRTRSVALALASLIVVAALVVAVSMLGSDNGDLRLAVDERVKVDGELDTRGVAMSLHNDSDRTVSVGAISADDGRVEVAMLSTNKVTLFADPDAASLDLDVELAPGERYDFTLWVYAPECVPAPPWRFVTAEVNDVDATTDPQHVRFASPDALDAEPNQPRPTAIDACEG